MAQCFLKVNHLLLSEIHLSNLKEMEIGLLQYVQVHQVNSQDERCRRGTPLSSSLYAGMSCSESNKIGDGAAASAI